jgi:hypothetical protein
MAMKFKHMAMACLEFNCGYILGVAAIAANIIERERERRAMVKCTKEVTSKAVHVKTHVYVAIVVSFLVAFSVFGSLSLSLSHLVSPISCQYARASLWHACIPLYYRMHISLSHFMCVCVCACTLSHLTYSHVCVFGKFRKKHYYCIYYLPNKP